MTIAISEILQQVKLLSPKEQLELAAKLTEQAQQTINAMSAQAGQAEAEAPLFLSREAEAIEEEEDADWLDTLDLKLMPWKEITTARVRVQEVGRLQPLPHDFSDYFDDEEEGQ